MRATVRAAQAAALLVRSACSPRSIAQRRACRQHTGTCAGAGGTGIRAPRHAAARRRRWRRTEPHNGPRQQHPRRQHARGGPRGGVLPAHGVHAAAAARVGLPCAPPLPHDDAAGDGIPRGAPLPAACLLQRLLHTTHNLKDLYKLYMEDRVKSDGCVACGTAARWCRPLAAAAVCSLDVVTRLLYVCVHVAAVCEAGVEPAPGIIIQSQAMHIRTVQILQFSLCYHA